MLLKHPASSFFFGLAIIILTLTKVHVFARDGKQNDLFFPSQCSEKCDGSRKYIMHRERDNGECQPRCALGMFTWIFRVFGWNCGDCPDPIIQSDSIDFTDGFPCTGDELNLTFNTNSLLPYPALLPDHPHTEDKCYLRLTSTTVDTAVSAFQPFKFDSESNPTFAFSVNFEYRMFGGSKGADGMTFVIHTDSRGTSALGSGGWELGVYGFQVIAPALVIELDSYPAYGQEIRITTTSASNGSELGSIRMTVMTNPSGYSPGRVWIDYCPDGLLNVFCDPTGRTVTKPTTPQLSVPFNLWSFFEGEPDVFVGFTAATGAYSENHDVLSWTMVQRC